MTAAEIKKEFVAGHEFSVTNHYITREDHPCFGTRQVSVERVTSSSVYLAPGGRVPWPRASQMIRDADGTIRFFGGGVGQAADELFLTFKA